MVQGIPSPPTRDRPPPPSCTTQAHERQIDIINITASLSRCLGQQPQLDPRTACETVAVQAAKQRSMTKR
eukprot:1625309-Prymnesium_polylepis.1